MYVEKKFQLSDLDAMRSFIAQNSFGLIVSTDLNSTHLPFVCDVDENGKLCLFAHMAKANPHWKTIDNNRALVVFNGAHAYISPSWYATKPAVPTWNYVAVHCYGVVQLLDEDDTALRMRQLISHYEPSLLKDDSTMPEDYQQRLRQAVVGFKLEIDDIQGKEKLGQHRKHEDQLGVFSSLNNSADPVAKLLAEYMEERSLGNGET
ncbi:FMN-binding negative transcriptional regulator [Aliiglaciecola sp. 2_MG-2023]|uniref:FMN-binding negative transcriptional regulator n=1 Tax=unclassified Aliiglaciecola TaxID=2593648 RepID=UPI0026E14DE5|nr:MULTISPECIES: FMN-binding negative transcriptional regulator [unclassified Aliiglaciecola]MDO6712171.1 FMN-binding negative transcriptional regulator [Aliiglaciecola sp. 2_MG-2023]MDO6754565.1 FMN-binding negative transcriptional regulator [Aliiglaciecola sp. 1_MG-2023]